MTYAFLLESVWHPPLLFTEAAASAAPSPEELAVCWLDGAFGREWRVQGKRLVVRGFGAWNPGPGAELIGARIEVDGIEQRAAVAFAATAAGPVVAADHDLVVRVLPAGGSALPDGLTLNFPQPEVAAALGRPQREMAIAGAGRCTQPLRRLTAHAISSLLEEAARRRADQQAARWQRMVDAHGRRDALYQTMARALGQRINTLPMLQLAQRVPLDSLQRDPLLADALLAGTSGCLDGTRGEGGDSEWIQSLRPLWQDQLSSGVVFAGRPLRWDCARLHPSQHPQRRLGVLATLAGRWESFEQLAFARPFNVGALCDFLHELEHPFWSLHATVDGPAFPNRVAMCNRNIAMDLAAEWLIPVALAEGRMVWRDYLKLRHSAAHEGVRLAVMRLTGCLKRAAEWTKRLHHHQGLLQLDQDFLLEEGADWQDAPYPDSLLQWR